VAGKKTVQPQAAQTSEHETAARKRWISLTPLNSRLEVDRDSEKTRGILANAASEGGTDATGNGKGKGVLPCITHKRNCLTAVSFHIGLISFTYFHSTLKQNKEPLKEGSLCRVVL